MNPIIHKFGGFLLFAFNHPEQKIAAPATAAAPRNITDFSSFLRKTRKRFLLFVSADAKITLPEQSIRRFISAAEDTRSGLVYADYFVKEADSLLPHPLIDYQPGSIRDDFSFGPVLFFSAAAARKSLKKYGAPPRDPAYTLYDLRLKLSLDYPVIRIPEFLYSVEAEKETSEIREETSHFAYAAALTSRQKKLEKLATNYLKLSGAYLPPREKRAETAADTFPVRASIVIPVRNRIKTISAALQSALGQKTSFDFNIIVVDNHSTDGTTRAIEKLALGNPQIVHLIPRRQDLNIGGCWNEAVYSPFCGKYAVQLDSDDLYSSSDSLRKIVHTLESGKYAMIAGSYTIVDEKLRKIPPGLIDHREWTDSNGHNNLLRVNGLGAPRAFDTRILRLIGFPDVGYGEDYAAALRITREYRIGRIYENLYLCRRWSDNTDAALSVEKKNRNDFYKDRLRSMEIAARKQLNKSRRNT